MQVVKSIVDKPVIHKQNVSVMGIPFEISVVAADADWAEERIADAVAEIKRIDKLLTTLSEDSQVNLINYNAGIAPVKVNGELFKLITRSLETAELTGGAFDITYGTDLSYHKVALNAAECTVFLKERNMRIYFSGIAKGYAADRAKYVLQMEGVNSGVINAGGDLVAWGVQPDGQQWTIGTADPRQCLQPYADFIISNMAIATTVKRDNDHHLLENGDAKSVFIMSPSAELAGAMTTPVIMMGVGAGTELINRLQQFACVFVDDHNQLFASRFMNALN